jgi:CheY-like chemotaxis protein
MSDQLRILVVEDEALVREILEDTLVEAGFEVVLAFSGSDALTRLESGERFIAVISDIRLGAGASGWDVARRAREIVHDVPIVYMSGDSGGDWSSQGVPGSVLIGKPFTGSQVVTAVSILLNDLATHRSTSGSA